MTENIIVFSGKNALKWSELNKIKYLPMESGVKINLIQMDFFYAV